MRAPILAGVLAAGLVLGGAAAVAATAPTSQPSPPGGSVGDMRQMHEQMVRQYPEMGPLHERMLDDIPGLRGGNASRP